MMAGGHDASLLAIKSGQCDVGFAYDTMIDQVIAKGQLKQGDVKQVWKSEQIAGSPLAMNTQTLDADTQAKIRTAITTKANAPALVEAGICTPWWSATAGSPRSATGCCPATWTAAGCCCCPD